MIYSAQNYEAVKDFLLGDEYEQIRGRYQDLDADVSTPSLVLENKLQNRVISSSDRSFASAAIAKC